MSQTPMSQTPMSQTPCTCGECCQADTATSATVGNRPANGGAGPVASSGLASHTVTRRGMLTGSAAVVAGLAMAGCSSDDPVTTSPTTATTSPPATPDSTPDGTSSPTATESPAGERLVSTADIPVGGGAVLSASVGTVVVTHPADGEFKAFNGKCPHQGCPVSSVEGNTITCNCHGSTFDAQTGDRTGGPAMVGLTPVNVAVNGDAVYLT